jgi:hypothetical protein
MARVRFATVVVPFGLACLICMLSAERARAQFQAQGTDNIQSLGQFTIDVNPMFVQPVVNFYHNGNGPLADAGYTLIQQEGQTYLTSPVLYDGATLIARSSNITQGSNASVPVGSPAYAAAGNVSANDLTLLPKGWNPAPGTNEVYTAIQSLNLTSASLGYPSTYNTAVTAGAAIPAGMANSGVVSYGEVASQSSSSTGSFSANSFFDVFVNVNIGLGGGSGSSIDLYNKTPLLVENNGLMGFPPTVIYSHDASLGSPNLYISGGPMNGDLFGTILVSGHGAGYNQSDEGSFTQSYNQLLQAAGVIPEPSTWIMLLTAGVIVPAYARWGRLGRSPAKP